jgi:curved DNA-binding protein CbpA
MLLIFLKTNVSEMPFLAAQDERERKKRLEDEVNAKDAYEELGVASDATVEEILAAYEDKVQKCVPDEGGGEDKEAEEDAMFERIVAAYDKISTPQARSDYDRRRMWRAHAAKTAKTVAATNLSSADRAKAEKAATGEAELERRR